MVGKLGHCIVDAEDPYCLPQNFVAHQDLLIAEKIMICSSMRKNDISRSILSLHQCHKCKNHSTFGGSICFELVFMIDVLEVSEIYHNDVENEIFHFKSKTA